MMTDDDCGIQFTVSTCYKTKLLLDKKKNHDMNKRIKQKIIALVSKQHITTRIPVHVYSLPPSVRTCWPRTFISCSNPCGDIKYFGSLRIASLHIAGISPCYHQHYRPSVCLRSLMVLKWGHEYIPKIPWDVIRRDLYSSAEFYWFCYQRDTCFKFLLVVLTGKHSRR